MNARLELNCIFKLVVLVSTIPYSSPEDPSGLAYPPLFCMHSHAYRSLFAASLCLSLSVLCLRVK